MWKVRDKLIMILESVFIFYPGGKGGPGGLGKGQGQGGRGGDGLGPTLNIGTATVHVQGGAEINIRDRDIIISWLSPINFFLQHADISQLREKGTGGWLLADPVFKNGNPILEAPFGAVEFVCDSCLNMLPD
jgi:hypothetical protein